MRLAVCALSAVLLSGCSWFGGMGQGFGSKAHSAGGHYGANAPHCQIAHPQQPLPRGCSPSQVTLGTGAGGYGQNYAGGFPQQPQFGNPQYGGVTKVTGGYGSHAANAGAHHGIGKTPRLRKPKWRGSLSLGLEKSNSGNLLDYANSGAPDLTSTFTPFSQSSSTGLPSDGLVTSGVYTSRAEAFEAPSISFDDVHSTPMRIAAGVEYIMNPKTTVFANAAYSNAEGNAGAGGTVVGAIDSVTSYQGFGAANSPVGEPFIVAEELVNQPLAIYTYDFTDLRRYDLELGARRYFKPVLQNSMQRSLTPFVGASIGAAHLNAVSYDITQENLRLQPAFISEGVDVAYDQLQGPRQTVDFYDSQWVPTGQLNAGVEWQVSPKTALAFETGVKFEGARDYRNGNKGDDNIAIPFTIRGSYNF